MASKTCPDHGSEATYRPARGSRRVRCAVCGWDWKPERDEKRVRPDHADLAARKPHHECGDLVREPDHVRDGGPYANVGPCADGSPCGLKVTGLAPIGDGMAVAFCTRHNPTED